MEEKAISKGLGSFWSVFNLGKRSKLSYRKSNSSHFFKSLYSLEEGLTLVELIVVIMIMAVLITFSLMLYNPIKQIEKARDAVRISDLKQISGSLDVYTNDNNSYPATLTFGASFSKSGTLYMQKVPQDPECNGGSCYGYMADVSKSQWAVIFAKIYNITNNSEFCPLQNFSSCLPTNYNQKGYTYCVLLGQPDCTYISTHAIP